MLICLKPGVFLANPIFKQFKNQLPAKFNKWKFIYPENFNLKTTIGLSNIDI